jgi:hypothetical protein
MAEKPFMSLYLRWWMFGCMPIGDQLVEKLKQLSLGVSTKTIEIEQVTVGRNWFLGL